MCERSGLEKHTHIYFDLRVWVYHDIKTHLKSELTPGEDVINCSGLVIMVKKYWASGVGGSLEASRSGGILLSIRQRTSSK